MSPQGSPDFSENTQSGTEAAARDPSNIHNYLAHPVITAGNNESVTFATNNTDSNMYMIAYSVALRGANGDLLPDIYAKWETQDENGNSLVSFLAQGSGMSGTIPEGVMVIPPGGQIFLRIWNDTASDFEVYHSTTWVEGEY